MIQELYPKQEGSLRSISLYKKTSAVSLFISLKVHAPYTWKYHSLNHMPSIMYLLFHLLWHLLMDTSKHHSSTFEFLLQSVIWDYLFIYQK